MGSSLCLREQSLPARGYGFGALAALGLLFALWPLVQPVLQNADTAVYNDQIDARDLGGRTTHIGYMALGVLFRALIPGQTDRVMNAMTLILGVAGLYAVYAASYRLCRSSLGGLLAAASVAAIPVYLKGMLLSEVDVPLAAFVAIAFCFALHERVILAATAYGCAMLISPLGGLSLAPVLIAVTWPLGTRNNLATWLRRFMLFAAVSVAIYGSVVVPHWQEYIYGGRGLLHAPRRAFNLAAHARRSLHFAERELGPMLGLWLLASASALRRKLYGLVLGGLLAVAVALTFGERFVDVPVQLPTALLLAPWLGFVVATQQRALNGALALASAALIAQWGSEAFLGTSALVARATAERAAYDALRRQSSHELLLANANGFSDYCMVRMLFGRVDVEQVFDRPHFQRECEHIARAEETYTIVLARGPFRAPCAALEARYELVTQRAGSRQFKLLVARTQPLAEGPGAKPVRRKRRARPHVGGRAP